ncbi:MAG: hypothetical protein F4Y50_03150 [Dehalococcoidia bacterium]|nr:hypothetical protein [Dehalococcoidia bacterium]
MPDRDYTEAVILQVSSEPGVDLSLFRSIMMRSIYKNTDTGHVSSVVVEVGLYVHPWRRTVLGIVGQPDSVRMEKPEEFPLQR